MKAITLLLLRISTGTLLILWGLLRVRSPETGTGLSNKYYNGLLDGASIQMGFGIAEVILGALVIVGLLRIIAYPLQTIILGLGVAFIWQHILDPLSLYLWEEGTRANLLFFPSTTVFFATLIILAFKDYDTLALDRILKRS